MDSELATQIKTSICIRIRRGGIQSRQTATRRKRERKRQKNPSETPRMALSWLKSNPGPIIGGQDGGGGRVAIRQGERIMGISRSIGADIPGGQANRARNTFAPRCDGENSRDHVGDRIRHRHGTGSPVGSKISQVFESSGYAARRGNATDPIYHGVGSAEKCSGPGIRPGSGQISVPPYDQRKVGSHSIPDGGGGSSFLGTLVEGIKDRLIYGPGVLLKIILRPIIFLLLTVWYFGQAVATGDIFPIKSKRKIFDQGKEVGSLDGGKPRTVGRILALIILALINAGWELGVVAAWVGLTLGAFVGIQLGLLDNPAGDNWMWAVNAAAGAAGIVLMIVVAKVIYQRKIEGLNTLIPKMFGLQEKPEQEEPQPYVRRDDDILVNQIENALADWAENLDSKIEKIKKAGQD